VFSVTWVRHPSAIFSKGFPLIFSRSLRLLFRKPLGYQAGLLNFTETREDIVHAETWPIFLQDSVNDPRRLVARFEDPEEMFLRVRLAEPASIVMTHLHGL
jgi:hypothetical protein